MAAGAAEVRVVASAKDTVCPEIPAPNETINISMDGVLVEVIEGEDTVTVTAYVVTEVPVEKLNEDTGSGRQLSLFDNSSAGSVLQRFWFVGNRPG